MSHEAEKVDNWIKRVGLDSLIVQQHQRKFDDENTAVVGVDFLRMLHVDLSKRLQIAKVFSYVDISHPIGECFGAQLLELLHF